MSDRLDNLHSVDDFNPKAVFFDLDGTLIDSLPDIEAAIKQAALAMGLEAPGASQVRAWIGNGAGVLVERVLADSIHIPPHKDARYKALLDGYMQAYGKLEHAYSRIYPGVEQWLQSLQEQQIKLAVITNKAACFTPSILAHFGILRYFDLVYCGDTFSQKKPHPMPLLKACEAFSVKPEEALMVGDSRNDVVAAQSAGIRSLAVRGGYNHGEDIALTKPTWIVDSLEQVGV
ncbi:MAG: phosphoglycolate phosphatase [Gammaproteobacteria bacterium]|jgi:phosphoglycolate phosphatase|nr:phosphoglycolate phosphatase [Gammaproteobacteria bacterium]